LRVHLDVVQHLGDAGTIFGYMPCLLISAACSPLDLPNTRSRGTSHTRSRILMFTAPLPTGCIPSENKGGLRTWHQGDGQVAHPEGLQYLVRFFDLAPKLRSDSEACLDSQIINHGPLPPWQDRGQYPRADGTFPHFSMALCRLCRLLWVS